MARKPKLPETMRAAAIEGFGGPEVLRLRTLPVPSVGAFEVLIAVHTAGVGSWDPEMRAGRFPSGKTRFPLVLGSDGSGKQLNHVLETLRPDGRLAYPNGVEPEPKRRKGLKVITYDAVAGVGEFERLNRAVSAAKLKVPSAAAFPLAEAWKAHKRLERGHVLGRVVLRVR